MAQSEYTVTLHCDGAGVNSIDRLSILLAQFAQAEHLSMRIDVHKSPYICLRARDRVHRLLRGDLLCLMSDGHYCVCHMTTGDLRLRISFRNAADQILSDENADDFYEINRGILVGRAHIVDHTGSAFLLDNGMLLPVRRADRARLFHAFDQ